jgi:2,3-bisphosphoglycerate-dependent phosphoglycerate mutase
MPKLILVRHGESVWNKTNRFTGWVDIPLTENGILEAMKTAKELKGIKINHAFVSNLVRAQETLHIILSSQKLTGLFLHPGEKKDNWYTCMHHSERTEILTHVTNLLNERYYGVLQGLDKDAVRKKYGEKKVTAWRRSYDVRPPGGESLQDVYKRVVPFFIKRVIPLLREDKNVIISSHGNTLRAIIKYLDAISSDKVTNLNLSPAIPIVYRYNKNTFLRMSPLGFDRPTMWTCKKCN